MEIREGRSPFCISFLSADTMLKGNFLMEDDDEPWEGIHYSANGVLEWLPIGEEAEFSSLMICCNKKHEDFGAICKATTNCAEGQPVASSLVQLFRSLYST